MDSEKDLYIKEKLKKDELISKKADDVFNDFFGGKIKMEEEKVVNINNSKDKKFKMKNILSMVATLVVVFLGANVYAVTQGYSNIFFMIKDLSKTETISGKDEILKDQDITISYESIEIAENVFVQFNRFIVKDNKATLMMAIDERNDVPVNKKISQVEIENGEDSTQLATVTFKDNDKLLGDEQEIEIGFFNDNIKTLKVTINSSTEKLAVMKIDLDKREIVVLSNSYKEIEKISEIELKDILNRYAILNSYDDLDLQNANYDDLGLYIIDKNDARPTKEQFVNNNLVQCAIEYIKDKENFDFENGASKEIVNKVIKEMTGIEVKDHLDMNNGFYKYSKENNKYSHANGDGQLIALCLDITDISYEDGIYTVEYQYCYPGDQILTRVDFNTLPIYESVLQFKLNENYEYVKYNIVSNVYKLKGQRIDAEEIKKPDTETDGDQELIEKYSNGYNSLENAAIEFRYSSKIKNYKDFNYDLDGDGKLDKITIRKDKSDEEERKYIFELNGIEFEQNEFSPEIYIVDLDKTDKNLEVLIFDIGPSDDLEYSIYVKNGNEMKKVETIAGSNLILDGKGNFKVKSILTLGITPDVYDITYNFNNNKITSKPNEFDKDLDYSTYGLAYITKDLANVEKYYNGEASTLEEAGIKKISEEESFKIKYFIDATQAVIEYKGSEYYLLSNQGNFAD